MTSPLRRSLLLLGLLALCSCDSKPTASNNQAPGPTPQMVNSRFQNKGIHWVVATLSFPIDTMVETLSVQPDSNITNFTLDTSRIPRALTGDQPPPPGCVAISKTQRVCPIPRSLEFRDSSLDLRGYSAIRISFQIDTAIPNLTVGLEKIIALSYTNNYPDTSSTHAALTKTINTVKGSNTVTLSTTNSPSPGTGYFLSFAVIDSTLRSGIPPFPQGFPVHQVEFALLP